MKKTTPLRIALLFSLGAGTAFSCANTTSEGTDSSTHWLDQCRTDADCGDLQCECGVCTKPCSTPGDCRALSANASCAPVPGCSSGAAVCARPAPAQDGGPSPVGSSGGPCPSGIVENDHCDGRIEQCWLPCNVGTRGQMVCGGGTWIAGKGLFPCTSGGECPADVQSAASCDGSIEQCWTACNRGFQSQFECSAGMWIAGHGLFPCGPDAGITTTTDAGTKKDAGSSLPGVSTSCIRSADCYAADAICCPRCDTEPTVATKTGIARTSMSTYRDELCATAGACPPCVPPPGTIDAFCRGGTCQVEDLHKYNACTRDADCKLVPKDCCACGSLPAAAFTALSDEPGFVGDRCATVDCAGCPGGPQVADASRATCNTTYGYCEIAPPR